MQMPLVSGRDFDERDTRASPKVAVINETFARRIVGEAAPLGRELIAGADRLIVVGVARDSKQYTLREEFRPIVYTAASQAAEPSLSVAE